MLAVCLSIAPSSAHAMVLGGSGYYVGFTKSQQGFLATYSIPGCVGKGVRLGSENSSSAVWKSGNLEISEFGDLETWKSRNLGSKKSMTPAYDPKQVCRRLLVENSWWLSTPGRGG